MQKAVPTIIILILLFWYFRAMLFNPLGRILKEREELTEGARRAAEKSLKLAEAKQEEFEQKFAISVDPAVQKAIKRIAIDIGTLLVARKA